MNTIHPNESIRIQHDGSSYCTTFHAAKEMYNLTAVEIAALSEGSVIKRMSIRLQTESSYQSHQTFEHGRKLHEEMGGEVPSLDQQIEFMQNKLTKYVASKAGFSGKMHSAIIENLRGIKRWNESQVYHGKVDVVKVIEDLIQVAEVKSMHPVIQNAEAAIGMIQAFQQERTTPRKPNVILTSGGKVHDNSKFPRSVYESFAKPEWGPSVMQYGPGDSARSITEGSDVSDVEYETYAPLRLGKWKGKDPKSNAEFVCIVSDTKTAHDSKAADIEYYGGYLVAESIPYHLALQIIEAYNEKFGEKSDPTTYAPVRERVYNELHNALMSDSFNTNTWGIIRAIEDIVMELTRK